MSTAGSVGPRVSIVIVAWNGRTLLEECLARVYASRFLPGFEVLVVDNGSTDGAPEMVEQLYPQARVIRSGANLGFGAGNNLGFREARGELVLMLNPDAFLDDPDTLTRLAAFLDAHPEHAGVGCRLNFPDGRHQTGDAGHAPTPTTILAHGLALPMLWPGIRSVFLQTVSLDTPLDVDWISGALFMARREALLAVGGFDTRYFLYAEDVDLGCRLRDAGWRLAYLPDVAATHVQGGTQGADGSGHVSTLWLDGLATLYARRNPGRFAVFRLAMGLGFALRSLAYGIVAAAGRGPRLAARARAMVVFARHVLTMPRPTA